MRVEHPHFTRADAPDFVRSVAQLKYDSGHTLNREVFVQSADKRLRRLEDDPVIRGVGNCAAVGDRHQPRATPAAQAMIDRVVMQVSCTPAAASAKAF